MKVLLLLTSVGGYGDNLRDELGVVLVGLFKKFRSNLGWGSNDGSHGKSN